MEEYDYLEAQLNGSAPPAGAAAEENGKSSKREKKDKDRRRSRSRSRSRDRKSSRRSRCVHVTKWFYDGSITCFSTEENMPAFEQLGFRYCPLYNKGLPSFLMCTTTIRGSLHNLLISISCLD